MAEQGQPSRDYTGAANPNELATRLSDLARDLQREDSLQGTLNGIVGAAVQTVPGAAHAGLTVVERRREVRTPASTGPIVEDIDRMQYETGQGPCLEATYRQRTVRLSDMARETRWPEFSRRALAAGVGSMLSLQMYVVGDNLGALNLYAREPHAFGDDLEYVGLLFASHAAIAMAAARQAQNLTAALSARDLIGQAKGILMEREKITGDRAFELLVAASQRSNVRLADVAHRLVTTGELAGPERHR